MHKAFKYRLYPNKEQAAQLQRTLDLCRRLYNAALDQRRMVYQSHKKSLSKNSQITELPALKLSLSKIGNINIKLHRPLEGTIKTCTLKREVDQWFAVFTCELPEPEPVAPQTAVGIDVGIESFAVTSEGEAIENPRHLPRAQQKLRRLSRALARKKKGSQRRTKARLWLAKQHRKVKRQRRDFQHKVARRLVNRYDLIAVEDLNVKGMVHGQESPPCSSNIRRGLERIREPSLFQSGGGWEESRSRACSLHFASV